MQSFLEVLRGRMQQRRSNAADRLAAAARDAAADKSVDVGAIEAALVETGTALADFEASVEQARKRAEWRADFEQLASVSSKVEKLEAKLTSEVEKRAEALRAADERIIALERQLAEANAIKTRGTAARDKLTAPADVPGPVGEDYRQALADKEEAEAEVARINRGLREARERANLERGFIDELKATKEVRGFHKSSSTPEWAADGFAGQLTKHETNLKRAKRKEAELLEQLPAAERALTKASKTIEQLLPKVVAA